MGTEMRSVRSFSDVKALMGMVNTHKALCALNDAVEERFLLQQLSMTDEDWDEWTLLVKRKADQIEQQSEEHKFA